jgi:hypothetical protein
MAQIFFGVQGMWVEVVTVAEPGIPGNNESRLKTVLDVTRSFLWAIGSQFYQPHCSKVTSLAKVNLDWWRNAGFKCEHQAQLD